MATAVYSSRVTFAVPRQDVAWPGQANRGLVERLPSTSAWTKRAATQVLEICSRFRSSSGPCPPQLPENLGFEGQRPAEWGAGDDFRDIRRRRQHRVPVPRCAEGSVVDNDTFCSSLWRCLFPLLPGAHVSTMFIMASFG